MIEVEDWVSIASIAFTLVLVELNGNGVYDLTRGFSLPCPEEDVFLYLVTDCNVIITTGDSVSDFRNVSS